MYPGDELPELGHNNFFQNVTVFFQTKSCVPKGFCRKTKKLPVSIDPVLNKTSNRYFLKCGEVRNSLTPIRWELDGEILFKSKIEL